MIHNFFIHSVKRMYTSFSERLQNSRTLNINKNIFEIYLVSSQPQEEIKLR